MNITATKETDIKHLQSILKFVYDLEDSKMDLEKLFYQGHSIERTQIYTIWMKDIPHKVSMQLRTCAGAGQFHLVGSKRFDWMKDSDEGGVSCKEEWDESQHRLTPQNHVIMLNATNLKTMSHLRLCTKAEKETQEVMLKIRDAVYLVDPDMAMNMMPECQHRGGICTHPKPCGLQRAMLKSMIGQVPESMYRDARNEYAISVANGEVIE